MVNQLWLRFVALFAATQSPENNVIPAKITTPIEIFSACPLEIQELILAQWIKKKLPLSPGKFIKLYDVQDPLMPTAIPVSLIAFDPQNERLAFVAGGPLVNIWNVQKGKHESIIGENIWGPAITSVAFNHDGSQLGTTSASDRTICLYHTQSGEIIHRLDNNVAWSGPCRVIAFNPHGSQLAAAHPSSGIVYIWDSQNGDILRALTNDATGITSVTFSPNGSQVAIGDRSGKVNLWNIQTHEHKVIYKDQNTINSITFNHDGTQLVTASNWGTVSQVNVRTGSRKPILQNRQHWPDNSGTLNCTGTEFASGYGTDGTINIWNVKSGNLLYTLRELRDFKAIAFDNDQGIAVEKNGAIHMWNESDRPLHKYFKTATTDESRLLLFLIHYQDYLKKKYPKRGAIRIQDVALFAQAINVKNYVSVESLTATAKKLPFNTRRTLVSHFGIYDCTDEQMDMRLAELRRL